MTRITLWLVFPLCMLLSTAARGELPERVTADFRERFDPALFHLMGGPTGECCRLDESGVRCRIAKGDGVNFGGLNTRAVIGGDFVITAQYQIRRLPEPPGGHGAGVKISIKDTADEGASLQRLHMRGGRQGWSAHRAAIQPDGGTQHSSEVVNSSAPTGRLRLMRSGSTLHYLVAEGESGEFQEIRSVEFSDRDLVQLYFAVQTGDVDTEVDVAWSGVEIEAERLIRAFEYAGEGWPVGRILLGVLLAGAATLGGVMIVRRRKAR